MLSDGYLTMQLKHIVSICLFVWLVEARDYEEYSLSIASNDGPVEISSGDTFGANYGISIQPENNRKNSPSTLHIGLLVFEFQSSDGILIQQVMAIPDAEIVISANSTNFTVQWKNWSAGSNGSVTVLQRFLPNYGCPLYSQGYYKAYAINDSAPVNGIAGEFFKRVLPMALSFNDSLSGVLYYSDDENHTSALLSLDFNPKVISNSSTGNNNILFCVSTSTSNSNNWISLEGPERTIDSTNLLTQIKVFEMRSTDHNVPPIDENHYDEMQPCNYNNNNCKLTVQVNPNEHSHFQLLIASTSPLEPQQQYKTSFQVLVTMGDSCNINGPSGSSSSMDSFFGLSKFHFILIAAGSSLILVVLMAAVALYARRMREERWKALYQQLNNSPQSS